MKEQFRENRKTVYLQPEIRGIIEAVAQSDDLLLPGEKPNVSRAVAKIVTEWQRLKKFEPSTLGVQQ